MPTIKVTIKAIGEQCTPVHQFANSISKAAVGELILLDVGAGFSKEFQPPTDNRYKPAPFGDSNRRARAFFTISEY